MNAVRWSPLTIPSDAPSNPDGIDFSLTQSEHTQAAIAYAHIEHARRRKNERDEQARIDQDARDADRALLDWSPGQVS